MKPTILLILFFVTANLSSQENFHPVKNEHAVKPKFNKRANTLTSIKSDFVQEKYLASLSSTIVSSGKFWYKKSNKLRWEYTKPFKYIIIIKDKKVTVKDENNTTIYNKNPNKIFQQLNGILASSVNGTLINNPRYTFALSENTKQYQIKLTPTNIEDKEVFSNIQLFFLKSTMAVYRIKILESSGDSITITFKNKVINTPISEKVFQVN